MPNEFQEQIELNVKDNSKQGTDSANRNLAAVETQAKKTATAVSDSVDSQIKKVVTITQQATAQLERTVRAAERRAQFAAAPDPGSRLQAQQALERQRVQGDQQRLERLITAQNQETAAIKRQEDEEKRLGALKDANAVKQRALLSEQTRAQTLLAEKQALLNKLQTTGAAEKEIKAVTAAYGTLIKKEEEAAAAEKVRQATARGSAIGGILRGDFSGISTLGGGLGAIATAVGPTLIGLAGVAAAATGVATAVYQSAKSLGEYARNIRDVQARTGLTVPEVERFEIVAKAAGTDVSITSRMIRTLTQEITGTSGAAQRAQKELSQMGINVQDLRLGAISTGTALTTILDAVTKMPAGIERTRVLMDLFKKQGQDAVTFAERYVAMKDQLGGIFGPTEEQIARWDKYNDDLAIIDQKWKDIKLNVADAVASLMPLLVKASNLLAQLAEHPASSAGPIVAGGALGGIVGGIIGGPLGARIGVGLGAAGGGIVAAQQAELQAIQDQIDAKNRIGQGGPDAATRNAINVADQVISRQKQQLDLDGQLKKAEEDLNNARKEFLKTPEEQRADLAEQIKAVGLGPALRAYQEAQKQLPILEARVTGLKDAIKAKNASEELAKKAHEEVAGALAQEAEYMKILRGEVDQTGAATARVNTILANFAKQRAALQEKVGQGEILPGAGQLQLQTLGVQTNVQLAKEMTDIVAKSRTDILKPIDEAAAKSNEFAGKQLTQQLTYNEEIAKVQIETIDEIFAYSDKAAEVNRNRQLAQLEAFDAKTLDQKIALEQAKLGIEEQFQQAALVNREDALRRAADAEITDAGKKLATGAVNQEQFDQLVQAINDKYLQQRINAEQDAQDTINQHRLETSINVNKQIIQADQEMYDQIKGDVDELFQGMLGGGKKFLDAFKDVMKKTFLEPLESAISGQIAAKITQTVTGDQVTMKTNPMGGSIMDRVLGRAGVGTVPQFKTKADQPNHINDLLLYNGGVPVVIMNPNSTTTPLQPGTGGGSTVGGSVILNNVYGDLHGIIGQISGGHAAAVSGGGTGAGISQSSITFPGAGGGGDVTYTTPGQIFGGTAGGVGPIPLGGPIFGGATAGGLIEPGGFTGQSNLPLSLPGGNYGGLLGPITGTGGGGGGIGGILGSLGIPGLGGAGGVPTGTSSGGVGIPIGSASALGSGGLAGLISGGITMGGLALMKSGMTGRYGREAAGAIPTGIGGFMAGSQLGPLLTSGYLTPLGGGLAGIGIGVGLHGLAQGGVSGLIQSTAGFAEAGFILGGPIGAAIGAGIGLVAGGIRMLIKTTTQKIHDQVKSTYGIDIKDQGVLQQLAGMVKNYGGNVGATILSMPARQLIQLYALSTGQNARGLVATPVASQYSNTGGQLTAVPSYFNGSPVYPGQLQSTVGYSYLNPGVYNATSNYLGTGLPPVGANVAPVGANASPMAVNLSLDGPSTQSLLQGGAVQAIQANPRLVSVATISGQDASAGRRDSSVNVLQPSFVVS